MKININHQIQELPQEQQDNLSQCELNLKAPPPPPTPEEPDEYFGLGWHLNDHGYMETYIFID
jgi:hypothetical protein